MTEDQITDQEIDIHDDNEVVEATTHDPKNAEAQSVASEEEPQQQNQDEPDANEAPAD